jgi:hypothetical protein
LKCEGSPEPGVCPDETSFDKDPRLRIAMPIMMARQCRPRSPNCFRIVSIARSAASENNDPLMCFTDEETIRTHRYRLETGIARRKSPSRTVTVIPMPFWPYHRQTEITTWLTARYDVNAVVIIGRASYLESVIDTPDIWRLTSSSFSGALPHPD